MLGGFVGRGNGHRNRMGTHRAGALAAAAALAAALVAAAHPSGADAQIACWRQVLYAWSNGVVGDDYPIPCYESALSHMPEDMRVYSSAQDDIKRAMLAAIRAQGRSADVASRSPAGIGRAHTVAAAAAPTPAAHPTGVPIPLLVLTGVLAALAAAGALVPVRRALRRRPPKS